MEAGNVGLITLEKDDQHNEAVVASSRELMEGVDSAQARLALLD